VDALGKMDLYLWILGMLTDIKDFRFGSSKAIFSNAQWEVQPDLANSQNPHAHFFSGFLAK
jgi:hypothetical protein